MADISPFFTSPIAIMQEPRPDASGYLLGRVPVSSQPSPTRSPCSKKEERSAPAIFKRTDSRDPDAFHIFPMEVDKDVAMKTQPPASKATRGTVPGKEGIEIHAAPENTPNTPVFKNRHNDSATTCGKNSRDVASPKLENRAPDLLHERSVTEQNCPGSSNSQTSWKPPKPPKPLFLSDVDSTRCISRENVSPSLVLESPERKLDHIWPRSGSPFSAPPGCTRSRIHMTNRSILLQGMNYDIRKTQRKPWTNPRLGHWRCLPRSQPEQSPRSCFPKDDASRPFPMAFSPVDRSPLRQDFKIGRPRSANVHFQEIDDVFSTHPQEENSKGKALSDCFQKWGSRSVSQERGLITLSLVRKRSMQQPLSKFKYSFHLEVNRSIDSAAVASKEAQRWNPAGPNCDTARLLQVDLIAPMILLQILARLSMALRSLMSSEAAATVAKLVQFLSRLVIVPLLYILEKTGISIAIQAGKADTV
ncbi:hypothetical protein BO70DRAFT_215069 [Aspergillus heteromorphus CBS 117.55]|uniref:Uncharacterized protein n=1 Tax=Aspergillus heteromorphus CBS 117.55 TaxID=1448321 RepID=A0A317WKZ6_9EURO|nr:uncharacterized protein BO70DRAFT_215069 [Aspergillus heteromorphus CBS 117.55]PWY86979.1 hypothetical protein BO70DRAFT_215069 [Aspergillus heteromorphus CBS 117.55]